VELAVLFVFGRNDGVAEEVDVGRVEARARPSTPHLA
jgi:hypothetical protein